MLGLNGICHRLGFPGGSDGKESTCNVEDLGSIPDWGISPGEGNGYPLQYSCLENPHGQRSLTGCHPWACKESDMTEQLSRLRRIMIDLKKKKKNWKKKPLKDISWSITKWSTREVMLPTKIFMWIKLLPLALRFWSLIVLFIGGNSILYSRKKINIGLKNAAWENKDVF